ncbi:MAG: hypothetical protein ABI351_07260 [Herbaspirillum sp.]
MKNLSKLIWVVTASILTGCGGGGSDNAPTPSRPATSAEGFWNGTISTGYTGNIIILENGETWGIYTKNNVIQGVLHGKTTSSGTILAGTGNDFDLVQQAVVPDTYTGIFAAKDNIKITTSSKAIFNGKYSASYDQPASLVNVAGTYTGSGVSTGSSAQPILLNISSRGDVSANSLGCSISGTVTPRASGKNIFDTNITFAGTCALGNGATTTGVAYYDASTQQLLALALTSSKVDGFIYLGKRQ